MQDRERGDDESRTAVSALFPRIGDYEQLRSRGDTISMLNSDCFEIRRDWSRFLARAPEFRSDVLRAGTHIGSGTLLTAKRTERRDGAAHMPQAMLKRLKPWLRWAKKKPSRCLIINTFIDSCYLGPLRVNILSANPRIVVGLYSYRGRPPAGPK